MAQSFPVRLVPNLEMRAGLMLAAGDVRVTATDTRDGEHITVRFKCYRDNRPKGDDGRRPIPESDKNWVRVEFDQASHVFIEVPNPSGEWADKIGTYYPRDGRFFADKQADPERLNAARLIAHWLNTGSTLVSFGTYELREEDYCGRCGRTLTDPVSIERGIGPECYKAPTGSKHQQRVSHEAAAKHYEQQASLAVDTEVQDVLRRISDMQDHQVEHIRRELEMWQSQEPQRTLFGA